MVTRIEAYESFLIEAETYEGACVVLYCGWPASSPSDAIWLVPNSFALD